MAEKKATTKAKPKKDQLVEDRKVLNEIMTRTDKQSDLLGVRKTLIMAVRQLDSAIHSRKK